MTKLEKLSAQGDFIPLCTSRKKNRKKRPSCFFRFSISLHPFSQFNGISSCIPNVSNMYYIIDGIIMINNLEY